MKNVLFLVDKTGFGGVQTIANKLIESKINGVNMYYFFLRDVDHKFGTKKFDKPNVFYSKSKSRYGIKSFFELKSLIKKYNIDILHMNGDKSTLYGCLIKSFFMPDLKIIHHEHSGIFTENKIYHKMLNLFSKKIDLFIAVSFSTKKELISKSNIPEKKIRVVYNFVDLEKFDSKKNKFNRKIERKKFGINNKDFVIGYVGRLAKVKGCEYLIRSLPNLKFNYKCLIVGEGLEMSNLKKLSKSLNLNDKIKFLGYTKETERIYPIFDLFIMPSLSESFGISLLESQKMNVPIISSKIESLQEIGGNGAIFVNTKNSRELSSKINQIAKNKKLINKLIKNGNRNVMKFSIRNSIKDTLGVYNEL